MNLDKQTIHNLIEAMDLLDLTSSEDPYHEDWRKLYSQLHQAGRVN